MSRGSRRALLGGIAAAVGATPLVAPLGRAAAEGALPTPEQLRELELRRAESLLLHRKVELGGLRLLRDGVPARLPTERPVARLLILHLWSVECRPCVEEFPILRRITDALHDLPHVKTILVTETLDLESLRRFMGEHRGDLPRVDHYQCVDDRLRGSIQNRAQPLTLFLDAVGVNRQAFLGSLKQRRSEFADAIQRLSRAI